MRCTSCGHPQVTHMGGGCFCGCARFASVADPRPLGDAPVERFLDFLYARLSSDEVMRVLTAIAHAKRVKAPSTLHDDRQRFIIENLTRRETERYLAELERRECVGEPLLRLA